MNRDALCCTSKLTSESGRSQRRYRDGCGATMGCAAAYTNATANRVRRPATVLITRIFLKNKTAPIVNIRGTHPKKLGVPLIGVPSC